MFVVIVQQRGELIDFCALRVGEEAAPPLFTRFEPRSPNGAPTRCERGAAPDLGVDARVFRRDAEETTAAVPIILRIITFFSDNEMKNLAANSGSRLLELEHSLMDS